MKRLDHNDWEDQTINPTEVGPIPANLISSSETEAEDVIGEKPIEPPVIPATLHPDQWQAGNWAGHDQLTCRLCQWDTLHGEAVAIEHQSHCPRCGISTEMPPTAAAQEV